MEFVERIVHKVKQDVEKLKNEKTIKGVGFFVLKPDGVNDKVNGVPLIDYIKNLFDMLSISYCGDRLISLSKEDVYNIYPHLNLPSRQGSSDDWKNDVVNHMTSGDIQVGFIVENNALEILGILKTSIRDIRGEELLDVRLKIKNLIHSPDHDKYDEQESNKAVILKHIKNNNPYDDILNLFTFS